MVGTHAGEDGDPRTLDSLQNCFGLEARDEDDGVVGVDTGVHNAGMLALGGGSLDDTVSVVPDDLFQALGEADAGYVLDLQPGPGVDLHD